MAAKSASRNRTLPGSDRDTGAKRSHHSNPQPAGARRGTERVLLRPPLLRANTTHTTPRRIPGKRRLETVTTRRDAQPRRLVDSLPGPHVGYTGKSGHGGEPEHQGRIRATAGGTGTNAYRALAIVSNADARSQGDALADIGQFAALQQ